MTEFYVRVVVHGTIPAGNAGDALSLLCDRIREGIGPDPENGHREWDVSIAAGRVEGQPFIVNEEFLNRLNVNGEEQ